jgi:hypothetical protein
VAHCSLNPTCRSVCCLPCVQQAIRQLVDIFAGYSLRFNTRLTYNSRQQTFRTICASLRIDPDTPISERHLCVVCIIYARSHRITSLAGFVSAVNHHALQLGHPPLPRNRTFDRVRAGLANWHGDTNFSEPAKAITIADLRTVHASLNLSTFADARDWCASLFAFFGLLRIKEYTCAGLLVRHVTHELWGINLALPFSKTSLIPTAIAIVRRDDALCPVAAYLAYTALLPASSRQPHLPFFLHHARSDTPLTDSTFIRHVRQWVSHLLRQEPDEYSGHSFRRGGTTALQLAGVPEATIAAHGRWKSLAYRGYFDIQNNLRLRLTATAQLSLHSLSPQPSPQP